MTTKRRRLATVVTLAALSLTACGGADSPSSEGAAATEPTTTSSEATDVAGSTAIDDAVSVAAVAENQESHVGDDDPASIESDAVAIALQGSTATADDSSVEIDGSTVVIHESGSYSLSGTLTDGQVVVDAGDEDVTLVLDGVDIANGDGAAIAVISADRATIVLSAGSINALADGASYQFPDAETDEPNATLYSAADLTIAGDGELTVIGHYNDAIASKDGLVIESGTIAVDAVDDGIRGKDYVIVSAASVTVAAGGDAIKADNDEDIDRGYVQISGGVVTLAAGDDGVQAATDVIVTDGTLSIDAGTLSGTGRALQGDVLVAVSGGVIDASAVDDAIHSNDTVVIAGGTMTLAAGVSIGHNEYGAWGLTVFATDGEDLYVYETNPDNPNQYRYRDQWESMTVITEEIPVKGRNAHTAELKYTRHGPVVFEDRDRNLDERGDDANNAETVIAEIRRKP